MEASLSVYIYIARGFPPLTVAISGGPAPDPRGDRIWRSSANATVEQEQHGNTSVLALSCNGLSPVTMSVVPSGLVGQLPIQAHKISIFWGRRLQTDYRGTYSTIYKRLAVGSRLPSSLPFIPSSETSVSRLAAALRGVDRDARDNKGSPRLAPFTPEKLNISDRM